MEYYLISKELIELIAAALTAQGVDLSDKQFKDVPNLIESIESSSSGTSVAPLTIDGSDITTVWVGTYALYSAITPSSTTLYIITS